MRMALQTLAKFICRSIQISPCEVRLKFFKFILKQSADPYINIHELVSNSDTANSIKIVLPQALTVNYERARDDGLLLIFTPKLGIMSGQHLRGHIGNLRWPIYFLQR